MSVCVMRCPGLRVGEEGAAEVEGFPPRVRGRVASR